MKISETLFSVALRYDCDLEIRNEKITKFVLDMKMKILGHAKRDHLNFKISEHKQSVEFTPQGSYKLINKELAELMVSDCLNRIYEGNVFGSGWPQSPPKDYPHFRVE